MSIRRPHPPTQCYRPSGPLAGATHPSPEDLPIPVCPNAISRATYFTRTTCWRGTTSLMLFIEGTPTTFLINPIVLAWGLYGVFGLPLPTFHLVGPIRALNMIWPDIRQLRHEGSHYHDRSSSSAVVIDRVRITQSHLLAASLSCGVTSAPSADSQTVGVGENPHGLSDVHEKRWQPTLRQ